ncbi:hypothetical protein V8Z80_19000 [Orrella sp. JC864]|uniref:hypothetical protein n=1 Tax=Orrella sp. JC864 TaxID=3120298 RepID=UPI0012BC4DC5
MNKASILAGVLAALALGGCTYRDTTDDGRHDRAYHGAQERDLPVRAPGEQYPGAASPSPQQYPAPAPGRTMMPGGFHDPGPNYPWTGP